MKHVGYAPNLVDHRRSLGTAGALLTGALVLSGCAQTAEGDSIKPPAHCRVIPGVGKSFTAIAKISQSMALEGQADVQVNGNQLGIGESWGLDVARRTPHVYPADSVTYAVETGEAGKLHITGSYHGPTPPTCDVAVFPPADSE